VEEKPNLRTITYKFEKDDHYRIIPVSGVWGGPTPGGEIMVNLFHDAFSLPQDVKYAVSPDGRVGQEVARTVPENVQRILLAGMILTPAQADFIGRWLQENAQAVSNQARSQHAGDSKGDSKGNSK